MTREEKEYCEICSTYDSCTYLRPGCLTTITLTDEEWKETAFEKPHYSDDENIQKKFEFATKKTGIVRLLNAMCKEFSDESLKQFIEKYFEDNEL